ncbi:MAG: lysine biosynthesis protein LysW [Thermoplasmatota archaeon]
MSECPVCGCILECESVELSELLPCPDCGTDLEVTSTDPLSLETAPEEQEDWGE